MKFIIKTFGFLVTLAIFAAAYWFLLEPADREELFENTVTKVTGKSFDEIFHSGEMNLNNAATPSKEKNIKFWVAPMDANYRRDEPGKSPMGMDLVPIYEETAVEEKPAMTMGDVKDDDLLTHARRHSDPTYVCPMHPQVVKGESGNCPICGMNLVKKEMEVEDAPAMAMEDSKKEMVADDKSMMTMDDVKNDDLLTHARRHSDPTYVCPMHPQVVKGE
ncbi:MAG: heavy metal-binding domain-containing protein, partial [Cocleimonas sp.]